MVRHELEINPALEVQEEEDRSDSDDEFEDSLQEDGAEPEAIDERMEILAELGREWDNDETSVSSDDVVASQERMDYRMNALTEASSMRDQLMPAAPRVEPAASDCPAAARNAPRRGDWRG